MVKISIDLDNENIHNLADKSTTIRKSVLSDATKDMVRFLMQNSPVDHGLLKSWFIEYMTDEESSIKSPAKYAIYQDQGTRPYLIYPKKIGGYLYWDGAEHPVKRVAHPGIEGKHFVLQSQLAVEQRMPGYLARALERE